MIRLEMKNYNMILTKKQQKIPAWSSGKIDKHEYFTSDKIPPSDQRRVIEQAKFNYSPSEKVLEKDTKTTEDQGKKQVKAIEDHGKQLVISYWNELTMNLLKGILVSTETAYHLKNKKIYLMNLLKKGLLNLGI